MGKLKQALEEYVVEPIKSVDEVVLKQYTKLTKRWEDRGHSRYSLAHGFNLPVLFNYWCHPINTGGIVGSIIGSDLCRNIVGYFFPERDVTDDGTIVESDPVIRLYHKIANFTRLPLFLSGAGLMVKGGLSLVDYLQSQEPSSLNNALDDLSFGYVLFGTASSMYVKESNPKLLDKAPAWKRAMNSLGEIVGKYFAKPIPINIDCRGEN